MSGGPRYLASSEGRCYPGATMYQAIAAALREQGPLAPVAVLEVWRTADGGERRTPVEPCTVETWRRFHLEHGSTATTTGSRLRR